MGRRQFPDDPNDPYPARGSDADRQAWYDRRSARYREWTAGHCRAVPLPPSFRKGIWGSCKWCAKPILKADGTVNTRRMWHQDCVDDYNFCRSPWLTPVLEKTHGRCAGCNTQLRRFTSHGLTDMPLWMAPPGKRHEGGMVTPDGPYTRVESGWRKCEIDHVFPLWRVSVQLPWAARIEYFRLGNLQVLCVECHRQKTSREARDRARLRRNQGQLALDVRVPARISSAS